MTVVKKIFHAAHIYMILGVISGLYYREITKMNDFTGDTQLGVVHTHLLALGMLFFLIVLALEKVFTLSASKLFTWFFWVYNAGLALTVTMMTIHGTQTVLGATTNTAISLIAGLGHIVLTVGLILFFTTLGKQIPAKNSTGAQS
ncbi:hypothetical protein Lfu02_76850 [Longispora fulva]|uniref:Nitric oxide reductase large subunit n=1 Tax=Longispora fulva TaxID=619741 RepID=A0A8J7KPE0_9ACTN|nr:DUF2871 domain-containing protein [Longispora fulva]MBG6136197.1 nitric oxide reductase large subunit [Longispora fulva]GIG63313.1 hypothetical protein Lfu02_76850 [Longispora fulva]